MAHVIIGTAGHIDHGKTALVKALTGIETDTLPEERDRGVTIDIGFAYWKDNVTIIDVPGHERFVKNMVTGVCTVDLALFVVAADDGVMPQTREHLGILNLLGVPRGIVVLTKVDLVEEEWLELVEEELREVFAETFLENALIVPVSSITDEGIDALRAAVEEEIARVEARPDQGIFRLPVDRAFSVQGFGTVVTGTVISGEVRVRDALSVLPSGKSVRVRGVQTHGRDVDVARVGARAAINISGVEVDEVSRGDLLVQTGYFETTYMIDARLHMLPDAPAHVTNRTRVHLLMGPREVLARVVLLEGETLLPGESQLVQLRLEEPGVAARGDRFVIRRYSPVQTLGGGVVLDPQPVKHRRFRDDVNDALRDLEQDDPTQVLLTRLKAARLQPRTALQLASEMAVSASEIESQIVVLVNSGDVISYVQAGKAMYVHAMCWRELLDGIGDAMGVFHEAHPLRPGARREELRALVKGEPSDDLFAHGVEHLVHADILKSDNALIGLRDYKIALTPEQEEIRDAIARVLKDGGTTPEDLKTLPDAIQVNAKSVRDVVSAMQAMGGLVRLDDTLLFHPEVMEDVTRQLVDYLKENGEIDVSTFRSLIGTTRKFAVPLLNYFDTQGITIRQGDVRVLG